MIHPPIPADERERLQTLRDLDLLDTAPEERFDRITRIARQLFSVPIALVSLVDENRQWFKSRQGLDATETPRDISFCGHAIIGKEPLIVQDALEDERFADNPLVCEAPDIRFYAGCPITAPNGHRIGTLCLIDQEPRSFSADDSARLRELAMMVEDELSTLAQVTVDRVTGLSNRSGFLEIAGHLLPLCQRKEQPAALWMFQIQNLLDIESRISKEEAGATAVEFADILKNGFRESDVVARLSFDVFAVLLAGSSLNDTQQARKLLDEVMGERNSQQSTERFLELVSFAAAYEPSRHENASDLLRDAEAGLVEVSTTQVA